MEFSTIDAFLFDMDGVLFVGERALKGVSEALLAIRDSGRACRFVTNTTALSLGQICERCNRLGLPVTREEVFSSPRATSAYLKDRGARRIHLIAADSVLPEFRGFELNDDGPEFVVIGDIGEAWNYSVLNRAFRMIMSGAELIAMHDVRYWQVEDGLNMDIGAMVAGLEFATGSRATVIGKPYPALFRAALADAGVEATAAAMVGDDVFADVQGAQAAGMRGILVRTGKYREDLVRRSGVTPDLIIDSVAELPSLL